MRFLLIHDQAVPLNLFPKCTIIHWPINQLNGDNHIIVQRIYVFALFQDISLAFLLHQTQVCHLFQSPTSTLHNYVSFHLIIIIIIITTGKSIMVKVIVISFIIAMSIIQMHSSFLRNLDLSSMMVLHLFTNFECF